MPVILDLYPESKTPFKSAISQFGNSEFEIDWFMQNLSEDTSFCRLRLELEEEG